MQHLSPNVLNIVCHNVGGITRYSQVHRLLRTWSHHKAHLVCIQETWVGRSFGQSQQQCALWFDQAAEQLGLPRPQMWWGNNTSSDQHRAGVAVIQLQSGPGGSPLQLSAFDAQEDGRLLACQLQWAGHKLFLVNSYWYNDRAAQRRYMTGPLKAALHRHGTRKVLLLGDFNWVPNADLDRTRLLADGSAWNQDRLAEQQLGGDFLAMLQQLQLTVSDVFRARHPAVKGFTHVSGGSAARLDRMYLSAAAMPFVHSCKVAAVPGSDHVPLMTALLPVKLDRARGRGRWRAHLAFLSDVALQERLVSFARQHVDNLLYCSAQQLIDAWPRVKALYRQQVSECMQLFAAARRASPSEQAAVLVYRQALAALDVAPAAEQHVCLQQALQAQAHLSQATAATSHAAMQRQQARWLPAQDVAGPQFSRLLHTRASSPRLVMLTRPNGSLEDKPDQLAGMVVQHFAAVSSQPVVNVAAQAEVLAAWQLELDQGRARALPVEPSHAAGSQEVTQEEVRAALGKMAAGKAPGVDGLPAELWQLGQGVWVPLLSKLFTALGSTGHLPAGFSMGCVTPLHKAGEAAVVTNYRPITLLNADYKLLARVLASRFGMVMQGSFSSAQTAFLPGRLIGDGIAFSQLLHAALSLHGQPGAVVMLDIAKAYDTVDRGFLMQAMQTAGASAGMVDWVRLLLTDTRAVADVQGCLSQSALWHAGVRQGCPLSPLLYLFIAEALSMWLRQLQDVGVTVDGDRYTSTQYADDTKVYLPSLQEPVVTQLMAHLARYGEATGQLVNAGKSVAIALGTLTGLEAGTSTVIPVRDAQRSLGVRVSAVPVQPLQLLRHGLRGQVRDPVPELGPGVSPAWEQRIQGVRVMCNMVKGLPVSAMGRGITASSYALSKVLFHAQHEGLPQSCADKLRRVLAATVDRPGRLQLPGVPSALLSGSPRDGGFGLLPVVQHVTALHSQCCQQLLRGLGVGDGPGVGQVVPSWVPVAALVLRGVCPTLHPVQTLLLAAFSTEVHARQGRLTGVEAQRVLMPEGVLRNIGMALQRLGPLSFHPGHEGPPGVEPRLWLQQPNVPPAEVTAHAAHLVWGSQRDQPRGSALGPSRMLRVRAVTGMQLLSVQRQRAAAHRAFAAQALQGSGLDAGAGDCVALQFCRSFPRLWKLPWSNSHKETLWRLAVNGVQGAGGHDVCHRKPCMCGFQLSAEQLRAGDGTVHRQHAFWGCPVAQEVCRQLQLGLGQGVLLQQHHVWLLQPPAASVQLVVWQVTCLAALEAMARAHRYLWWMARREGVVPGGDGVQDQRLMLQAKARAAGLFWTALQDFVAQGKWPPGKGWEFVGPQHAFVGVQVSVPCIPRLVLQVPGGGM